MSCLRFSAVLHERYTGGAIVCMREAEVLVGEVAPPGEPYERRAP